MLEHGLAFGKHQNASNVEFMVKLRDKNIVTKNQENLFLFSRSIFLRYSSDKLKLKEAFCLFIFFLLLLHHKTLFERDFKRK